MRRGIRFSREAFEVAAKAKTAASRHAVFPLAVGRSMALGQSPLAGRSASMVCHGKGSVFQIGLKKAGNDFIFHLLASAISHSLRISQPQSAQHPSPADQTPGS